MYAVTLSLYGGASGDASGLGRVVAHVICKESAIRWAWVVSQQHRGEAPLALGASCHA